MVGERGDAEVVVQRLAVGSPQRRRRRAASPAMLAAAPRLAQRRAGPPAGPAVAAGGHERHDHVVAGREALGALAHLDDLAGRLVPEHHRHHPRARAVDHREVGVAQPGRADADEELAGPGGSSSSSTISSGRDSA